MLLVPLHKVSRTGNASASCTGDARFLVQMPQVLLVQETFDCTITDEEVIHKILTKLNTADDEVKVCDGSTLLPSQRIIAKQP